jgi:hypothetical protein
VKDRAQQNTLLNMLPAKEKTARKKATTPSTSQTTEPSSDVPMSDAATIGDETQQETQVDDMDMAGGWGLDETQPTQESQTQDGIVSFVPYGDLIPVY